MTNTNQEDAMLTQPDREVIAGAMLDAGADPREAVYRLTQAANAVFVGRYEVERFAAAVAAAADERASKLAPTPIAIAA